MVKSLLVAAIAALTFSYTHALNILLSNDDGFGSAQLVETFKLLKANGHDVVAVAPGILSPDVLINSSLRVIADNESGQGGRAVFTTQNTLAVASEFDLVPAGAPSLARSPIDPDIWYGIALHNLWCRY